MRYIDLHMHSVYSDGTYTPAELVAEYGLNETETEGLGGNDMLIPESFLVGLGVE